MEMSFEKWCLILNELKEAGILYVEFFGINKSNISLLLDLLEECYRMKFYTAVFLNNAWIDEKIVHKFDDFEVSHISLVLHSMDKKIHNDISNCESSFDNTMRAIDLLDDYRINFNINCLLTSTNIDSIFELENWSKANNYLLKIDPSLKFRKYKLDINNFPTPQQLEKYYQERSKRDFWHYFERVESLDSYVCDAGKARCAINGKGELFSCLEIPTPIGSLLEHSFFSLWQNQDSDYWRNIRKKDLTSFNCSTGFTCEHCPGESKRLVDNELQVRDYVKNVQKIKNQILSKLSR